MLTIEDGKKINNRREREHGVVYGTNSKGLTEFHLIENIPMKVFDNEKLGQVILGLKEDLKVERKRMAKKMETIREVLEHQENEITKLKEELKKHGMDY